MAVIFNILLRASSFSHLKWSYWCVTWQISHRYANPLTLAEGLICITNALLFVSNHTLNMQILYFIFILLPWLASLLRIFKLFASNKCTTFFSCSQKLMKKNLESKNKWEKFGNTVSSATILWSCLNESSQRGNVWYGALCACGCGCVHEYT